MFRVASVLAQSPKGADVTPGAVLSARRWRVHSFSGLWLNDPLRRAALQPSAVSWLPGAARPGEGRPVQPEGCGVQRCSLVATGGSRGEGGLLEAA